MLVFFRTIVNLTLFGCYRWHFLLLFVFFKSKSHNCLEKFGNMKKNIVICKNLFLDIGLTA